MKILIVIGAFLLGMGTGQHMPEQGKYLPFWPIAPIAVILVILGLLTGCAALPMPFQPQNQQYNSNMAEGAWLVLDGVDTLQTMHERQVRNPTTYVSCNREGDPIAQRIYGSQYPSKNRVLLTNIALATVHTMVTSWLDDKVAEHNGAGAWYYTRIAWHTASLAYSLSAVVNNIKEKCPL